MQGNVQFHFFKFPSTIHKGFSPFVPDYDCILHVNPFILNKGLAVVFNPTDSAITRELTLPLYYTGITKEAVTRQEGTGANVYYMLERDYTIVLPLSMKPKSITWYLIQSADPD